MWRFDTANNHQRGAALPLVLISILFLTLLGFMAMSTSSIEVRLSANERDYQQAVYAADAGIAHMRAILKDLLNVCNQHQQNDKDWDFVLRDIGVQCQPVTGPYSIQGNLNGFQYTVVIENNAEDTTGSATNDDDQIIILTSTVIGPSNVRAGVEMVLKAEDDDNNVSGYIQYRGVGSGKTGVGRDLNAVADPGSNERTEIDGLFGGGGKF
ncbi:MAG: pilus assembly PilX N-terminal domain-containing protein [Desulfuromonadales bacterium]|nr:pilus assembly PilX N-terminal domain-containing protein [Desulfuromonadales bacterium]